MTMRLLATGLLALLTVSAALGENFVSRTIEGHNAIFACIAVSPGGDVLASGGEAGTIKLWDYPTGREIRTLKGHKDWVTSVAFSADGKTLASASRDRTIILWNVLSGEKIGTLNGHTRFVLSVAFSPDGKVVASGGDDGRINLWDVQTGTRLRTYGSQNVNCITFTSDGGLMAAGSDGGSIGLWDRHTGEKIQTLDGQGGHWTSVNSVAFSPDGKTLAIGGCLGQVVLVRVQTGRVIRSLEVDRDGDSIESVAFSPDGKILGSGIGTSRQMLRRRGYQGDHRKRVNRSCLSGHERSARHMLSSALLLECEAGRRRVDVCPILLFVPPRPAGYPPWPQANRRLKHSSRTLKRIVRPWDNCSSGIARS